MFKLNWTIRRTLQRLVAVGFLLSLPEFAPDSTAQSSVTAFVDAGGNVVFTNLAHYDPPKASPSVARAGSLRSPRPHALDPMIDTISAQHGVDPALVRSVIEIESNFNRHAVSPKGAMGLMQLIPATGHRFGVRDFFDPAQNIDGGVRYLRLLLEMFRGNLDLSLAAYNAGENRVRRLGRIPAIRETQNYVLKVKSAYRRRGGATSGGTSVAYAQNRTPQPYANPGSPIQATENDPPVSRVIFSTVDTRGVARFSNVE